MEVNIKNEVLLISTYRKRTKLIIEDVNDFFDYYRMHAEKVKMHTELLEKYMMKAEMEMYSILQHIHTVEHTMPNFEERKKLLEQQSNA